MLPTRPILLLIVSAAAVATFARSSPMAPAGGTASEGVFSTFLVTIASFTDFLMGPLALLSNPFLRSGQFWCIYFILGYSANTPNGTILGFSFGGIIMSTSQALDNALAPMFSGIGGLVNGLVGTQGTTSPPFVLTKPPSPKSA